MIPYEYLIGGAIAIVLGVWAIRHDSKRIAREQEEREDEVDRMQGDDSLPDNPFPIEPGDIARINAEIERREQEVRIEQSHLTTLRAIKAEAYRQLLLLDKILAADAKVEHEYKHPEHGWLPCVVVVCDKDTWEIDYLLPEGLDRPGLSRRQTLFNASPEHVRVKRTLRATLNEDALSDPMLVSRGIFPDPVDAATPEQDAEYRLMADAQIAREEACPNKRHHEAIKLSGSDDGCPVCGYYSK